LSEVQVMALYVAFSGRTLAERRYFAPTASDRTVR
jgi:hypothetical protein